MVAEVIAACYDKVRLINDVRKYRSCVLQGLILKKIIEVFLCRGTANVEHEMYVYRQ
jgi:hypothetical protein